MKNTKLNQGLEPENIQDQPSKSKRKILASIGVSSGVLGASALSQHWAKPVVNSVILPAHAQMTEMPGGTMAPGGTTMAPEMTTMAPEMTTMAPEMTTMAPEMTTMAPDMGPMIMVTEVPTTIGGKGTGMVGDGDTISYEVSLSVKPVGDVTVTVTADPSDSAPTIAPNDPLTFMTGNYDTPQTVTLTAIVEVPEDGDVTVTFAASGGGYDDVEAEAMFTVVENDNLVPMDVKAELGVGANANHVTVTWKAPDTTSEIVGYIGRSGNSAVESKPVGPSVRTVTFEDHPRGTGVTFIVTADYKTGASQTSTADSDSTIAEIL